MTNAVVPALRELVAALDRRAANVERLGEASIVREAAVLRAKAMHRIRQLTIGNDDHAASDPTAAAVMTDDGCVEKNEDR